MFLLAATMVALAGSSGCRSGEESGAPLDGALSPVALSRSLGVVVGPTSDTPLGVAAVVRVTYDLVVVLALPRSRGEVAPLDSGARPGFRVAFPGAPPVAAAVVGTAGPLVALVCRREGRDTRPLEIAPRLVPGAWSSLVPTPRAPAPLFDPRRTIAVEAPASAFGDAGAGWLAQAPPLTEDDDRTGEERARDAVGGAVLDARGRLAGFVVGREGELPRVTLAGPVLPSLAPAILAPPGADLVRGDDGFIEYTLRVGALSALPCCEKEQDRGPMLVLEVRLAGELAGRVEVTPGRAVVPARVTARAPGPVEVQLVALDRSLAKGETREELARPAVFPGLAPTLAARLELTPEALSRHPTASVGPRVVRAVLSFEPVDPDRADGVRRSPLGARTLALGRLDEGSVDLPRGAATDFLAIETDRRVAVSALLYRRHLGARVQLQAFAPGFDDAVLALTTEEGGPRLSAASGILRPGRTLVRVRQVAGDVGTPYELLVAPRGDPSAFVATLFRLVAREASREGTAFLDSDEFVDEVAGALEGLELGKDAVASAVLEQLGGRVVSARRLALLLLERHFPPRREVLEEAMAQRGSAGADDAGLILAELDPRDARLRPLLRRITGDADAYVRARAVRVAARSGDPDFADEMAKILASDPAPCVERAVACARVEASRWRAVAEASGAR